MKAKACTKCNAVKTLDSFHKAPRGKWGRRSRCKICTRADNNKAQTRDGARKRTWKHRLKKDYGMTTSDYWERLSEQEGGCKICGKSEAKEGRRLSVDHCHRTGRVRGILCSKCNKGLGLLEDDPARLRLAAHYLEGK